MRLPIVEVLLLVGFGVFNLLIGPVAVSPRPPQKIALQVIAFGVLVGELGGLSIWLVWREIGFCRRLLVYWLLLSTLLACVFFGVATTGIRWGMLTATGQVRPYTLSIIARDAYCGLPLIALTVQLPLWAMRIYRGWRIERPTEQSVDPPRPLSIGDILAGTAVVAVSVAVLRFVGGHPGTFSASFRIGWVIAVPSIVSFLSLLPALVFLLRHQVLWRGVLSLLMYATATVVIPYVAILVLNPSVPLRADVVFLMLLAPYSFTATISAPLLVCRARGYRLTFPRDRKPDRFV